MLRGPEGTRRVAADDFFLDLLHTALGSQELLLQAEVPQDPPGSGSAYLKVEQTASGYALCGAAARVTLENGRCKALSLAFNGIAATPVRAELDGLLGSSLEEPEIAEALAGLEVEHPLSDRTASGEYRLELARVSGRRAVVAARERARSG